MQTMSGMDLTSMSLALSVILFAIGVAGVVVRRNAIILFLCIELMLNAVNLAFVAFSRTAGIDGQIFVFFVMTVAAAEAAVGLALVIAIFRHLETVDARNFNLLRW
jgi:NADH-quinone oxidoreductase subunit K